MEAISKSGHIFKGKLAELFVKIGIASPSDGGVEPKKTVKKVKKVKKAAPVIEKNPVVLLTKDKTDYAKPGKSDQKPLSPKTRTILGEIKGNEQKIKR